MRGFANASFLSDFDDIFYAATALGNGIVLADRSECIIDFVENGVELLRPIANDLRYDVTFHRRRLRRNRSSSTLDDANLYRGWLVDHAFDRQPPDHVAEMKQRFGVACSAEQIIDVGAYRFANVDLHDLDNEALLEHVFSDGLLERRTSVKVSDKNARYFAQYAVFLEARGDTDRADAVYVRLMHFKPEQAWLRQQYGDFLLRRQRFFEACRFYMGNITNREAGKWAFLNAASCCEQIVDLDEARRILEQACREFPEDQYLQRRRQTAASRLFADEFAYATASARAGKVSAAQVMAYNAAERCDFAPSGRAPGRPVRSVALFANLDLPQCNLYRVEQKSEQLAAAGYTAKIFDSNHDQTDFHDELAEYDAVIFFRVAAFPEVVRAINAARCAGALVFYETDDLIFDTEEFPEPFADYAGQITPAQHAEICVGVPLFRYAAQLCDYAIASTPTLAARLEPLVRERRAFVHRNALGLRHEAAIAARAPTDPSRPVTIFYGSGTKAHKRDFERLLLPALLEIDRRFDDKVRIVIAGHPPVGIDSQTVARFQFVAFTGETESYWALLSQADINLSVLRRTTLTSAKSEIKWLEAAMFGIPSVVSATDTFEEVIADGEDGFIVTDAAGFVDRLSLLVTDPARRRAVGEAARRKALRDYSKPAMAANLRHMFEAVQPPPREATRILVVNVFYAPQAKGGATRVVIDNIRDMRALYPDEFEFEVFTTREGGLGPYTVQAASHDGVRTTAMVAGEYPEVDFTATDARSGEVFARCLERFRPHLVHFHCIQRITTSACEAARARGIPYLVTAHDGWWISDRQFLHDKGPAPRYDFRLPPRLVSAPKVRHTRQHAMHGALAGAAAVLAVSDAFAAVYRDTGLSNVRSVPNGLPPLGVDAAQVAAAKAAARRTQVCLAHIGGLEQHKGFPLLKLAVMAAAPRNVTVLAVDLSLEPGDERFESWGDTPVRITARRKQEAMAGLYAEIDVLFAPSLWPESFGLVTREALAAGCWVVASDRGAVGDPVEEGLNGHIVSVDDLTGLIDIVRRIDADPARYLVPPPAGRSQRTCRDQAEDLAAIYRELVRAPAPADTSQPAVGAQGVAATLLGS